MQEIEEAYKAKGIPGDAGADRTVRFLRKLADLIARRWTVGEAETGAIFLLAGRVADVMKGRAGEAKPLLANGNDPITGKVWVVSAQLSDAHALTVKWETGGSLAPIVQAGLGHLPAIALDLRDVTRPPQTLFFPNGCGDLDAMLTVHVGNQPIDKDKLYGSLDVFYESNLRTPMVVSAGHGVDRIWAESTKGVPLPRPEESIEGLLLRYLKAVFPDHESRAQHRTDDGYTDISIHYGDRTVQGHPARRCDWLIELKALADRTANDTTSTTSVVEAITKGLRQAIAYSAAENSLEKALCVYDLRNVANDDESCFDHVRPDSLDNEVHLWRWRLLRSAEEGRKQTFPLKADSTSVKA